MANDADQLFKDVMKRLGIKEQKKLIGKAKEFQDLVGTRSSAIQTLNDYAKIIIFLDISSELQNVHFDTTAAIALSQLTKRLYNSNRQMVNFNNLNFNKKIDVNAALLKLCISNSNVEKTAKRFYEDYKSQNSLIDLDHPQYSYMSVFQACKLENIKVPKKKFMIYSNLNNTQWSNLEKSFNKWVSSVEKVGKENINSKLMTMEEPVQQEKMEGQKLKRKHEEPDIEDYDVWAKRTLDKAYTELKVLTG